MTSKDRQPLESGNPRREGVQVRVVAAAVTPTKARPPSAVRSTPTLGCLISAIDQRNIDMRQIYHVPAWDNVQRVLFIGGGGIPVAPRGALLWPQGEVQDTTTYL